VSEPPAAPRSPSPEAIGFPATGAADRAVGPVGVLATGPADRAVGMVGMVRWGVA